MANKFTFVGIDRYSDPAIRDLSGAGNDARALWALFEDTFPDSQSELLTDSDASQSNVRIALERALLNATDEDVVWVFFAGHGTRDHRLVMHDTRKSALTSTAIPMDEVAQLFKQTKARAAFLVLDCCFSGGITARVIEDSPLARDIGNPLEEIAGEGRIVITASSFNEPAYELPGHDHGVLTKALIDALEEQEHSSVLTILDKVMSRIAAEAARIGVIQTPVFLGDIRGGVVLPRLRRGENYQREFPDQSTITVGADIAGLAAFQIPDTILAEWSRRFAGGLNEVQLAAVNQFGVLAGNSLLVIAPTSSGKTFIGEMSAAKAITQNQKAVFLLPYRALVNEKFDQFQRSYGDAVGLRVIRCTGDYSDQVDAFVRGKYDLAVLTYEMFLNIVLAAPGVALQIGLVVLDEAQFITDPGRGITVELLLTYLIAARERGIHPQIVALSAVIGDANRFHEWLDVKVLRTERRPVPLTEGVLDRNGIFHKADGAAETLLSRFEIQQRTSKPSAQDVLVPLVRKLTAQGQKVLIFRNIRGRAEGCAQYLARDLQMPPVSEAIDQIPRLDGSGSSTALLECLRGGTAFHNSNLSREEKEVVERFFRDPASPLRVLVATTTVAAGINTPASTVIIAEQEFLGEDGREFTVAEYKNMAGRAGRLGFNEQGTSIILSETPADTYRMLGRYVNGSPESLQSSFNADELDTWLLRLLAQPQVRSLPRSEVPRLLASTYGGFLATASDPGWRQRTTAYIEQLLETMINLGLAEQSRVGIRLTPLGQVCGNSQLAFKSALRLIGLVRTLPSNMITAQNLLAIVQVLDETDSGYTPMYKKGQKESAQAQEAAMRFGDQIVMLLQQDADGIYGYWARCKRAAVAWDWIHGEPVDSIEQRYTMNPYQGKVGRGDIVSFADKTRWALRPVHQIVALIYPSTAPSGDDIDALCKSLEVGLPNDSLDLLTLSVRLTRGQYLALRNAGFRTANQVQKADRRQLEPLVGRENASRIIPEQEETLAIAAGAEATEVDVTRPPG